MNKKIISYVMLGIIVFNNGVLPANYVISEDTLLDTAFSDENIILNSNTMDETEKINAINIIEKNFTETREATENEKSFNQEENLEIEDEIDASLNDKEEIYPENVLVKDEDLLMENAKDNLDKDVEADVEEESQNIKKGEESLDEPVRNIVSGRGIMDQNPDFTRGEINIYRPDSLSDDTNFIDSPAMYTIMDRNLGAAEAGLGEDAYGYRYQFGNNYGFEGEQVGNTILRSQANVNLTQYSNSNPYFSGVFVLGKEGSTRYPDWATTSNDNIRGGNSIKESLRQGPCPEGWHTPTTSERNDVVAYWIEENGGMNLSEFINYLKLPFAGGLTRSDAVYEHVGLTGYFRTSNIEDGSNKRAYSFAISTSKYNIQFPENRVNGYSIRCFKDDNTIYTITYNDGVNDDDIFADQLGTGYRGDYYPSFTGGNLEWEGESRTFEGWYMERGGAYIQVYPETTQITSNTTLYAKWSVCGQGECIVPPVEEIVLDAYDLDIYFVEDDNISSHYTIEDRNLGAMEAGTGSASYGYHYQWGNNHGFVSCGTNSCTTFLSGDTANTTPVNTDGYGPGNYYDRNVFVKKSDWSTTKNDNLRGNTTDSAGNNPSARQGPCTAGYHVPSYNEWNTLQTDWLSINCENYSSLSLSEATGCAQKILNDLLMPTAGRRKNNGELGMLQAGVYWLSTPASSNAYGIFYYPAEASVVENALKFNAEDRGRGKSVRCVKDVYNTPLTISINGGTKASVSVYGGKLHYLTNPTKTGFEFAGWYTNSGLTTKIEDGHKIKSSVNTLYAKWISENDVEYTFNANGGMFILDFEETEQYVITSQNGDVFNPDDIVEPTRECHTFSGWYDEASGGNLIFFPDVVSNPITAYAHWTGGNCLVSTSIEGSGIIEIIALEGYLYGSTITLTANPNTGYIFNKWIVNGEDVLSGGSLNLDIVLTGNISITGDFVEIDCGVGAHLEGGVCVSNADTIQCDTSSTPENAAPIVAEVTITWDNGRSSPDACDWICDTGFHTEDNISCVGNTKTEMCIQSGKPENSTYKLKNVIVTRQGTRNNGNWPMAENCRWFCDNHYHENGNLCDIDTFEITWLDGDGGTLKIETVDYNVVPIYSGTVPRKTATSEYNYVFNNTWNPTPVAATQNATYTAQFDSNLISKGGKSSTLRKDDCPNGDFSDSYYDGDCGMSEYDKTGQSHGSSGEDSEIKEYYDVYKRAYENGLITKSQIDNKGFEKNLTRIEASKLLSDYAINILGKTGDNTKVNKFIDVPEYLDSLYGNSVSISYSLGIMGINMPNNRFKPFGIVPRSEFITALSRMTYGTTDGTDIYYSTHMNLMKDLGVIKYANPDIVETVGYALLMLKRSSDILK